jgi:hypothetical protein
MEAAWKAGHIVEPFREMHAESWAVAVPASADNTTIDAFLSVHCECLGSESPLRPRARAGLVSRAIFDEWKLAVAKRKNTQQRRKFYARGKQKLLPRRPKLRRKM